MSTLKNVASGAAAGSSGGFWGAAIGAGAGLLGSFLSSRSQSSANQTNLQIMREQNKFNAEQARIQRQWQEDMYNRYGPIL